MLKRLFYLRPQNWKLFIRQGKLTMRLLRDPRVPIYLKILPLLGAAYVVFPDPFGVIPIIGQLDDIAVIAGVVTVFVRLAPDHAVAEHQTALDAA